MRASRCAGLVLVGIATLLIGQSALASECPRFLGRYARGWTGAVAVAEGHVYFADGSALVLTEVLQDGTSLRVVDEVETSAMIMGFEVSGHHAFVAGDGGLRIVDLSSPESPLGVGLCPMPGVAEDVAVLGSHAYVVGGEWGLRVVDVSEPARPAEVGAVDTPGWAADVAAAVLRPGSYAVIADAQEGLRVIDVTEPARPLEAAGMRLDMEAWGVDLSGSRAHVVGGPGLELAVVDVFLPTQPWEVARWLVEEGGPGTAVAVSGDHAYVSGRSLVVVRLSGLGWPVRVGELELPGTGQDVAVWDDQVSVAAGGTLHFIDAENPRVPVERGTWSAGDLRLDAWGVASSGRYAYTFDYTKDGARPFGLRVLDVSDPAQPALVGSDSANPNLQGIAAAGSYVYVVGSEGRFRVVDVSDPTSPTEAGVLAAPVTSPLVHGGMFRQYPHADVEVAGNHAFVAGDNGLIIVDVSDPASPTAAGVLQGWFFAVEVQGNNAYLKDEAGLRIVDVSTPSLPVEVGSLALPVPGPGSVEISGGHAYVTTDYDGTLLLLSVIDVTSAESPEEVAMLGWLTGSPYRRDNVVTVSRGYALVAGGEGEQGRGGVLVLDVSEPSNPLELARLVTPGQAVAVVFAGERALLADGSAGLAVYDAAPCLGADPAPSLRIAMATFGTALANRTPVSVSVEGFELDCDGPVGPGRGRWQLWVDDALDSEACTETAMLSGWYPEGPHTLRAVLVDNAGDRLEPRVEDWIPVTVRDHVYSIAASASAAGAGGADWGSDAVLHVPGAEDAAVRLVFLEQEQDGTSAEPVELMVPAGGSLELADIVAEVFAESDTSGAILARSSRPLLITSRTFNDADEGTYGQYIPGVQREAWITRQDPVWLLQLTGTERFRTNIGLVNLHAADLEARVELFDSSGSALDVLTTTLLPWSYRQLNGVFAGKVTVEDGYAVVSASSADASYLAYASVVDNASGDPVFIAPVESSADVLYVPAAAHVAGAAGTNWRTDMEVYSAGAVQAGFSLEPLWARAAGSRAKSVAFTLDPATSVRYRDVIGSVFAAEGSAAIRIDIDAGELMVTSRTYNDLGDATYGQLIPGLTLGQAIAEGEEARLVQLAFSADPETGFRTNIGFASASPEAVEVDVDLHMGDGTLLGRRSYVLQPFSYLQETNVFGYVTGEDVPDGFAVVRSDTSGALYFAWASVVDNRSGDPTFIPAQRAGVPPV